MWCYFYAIIVGIAMASCPCVTNNDAHSCTREICPWQSTLSGCGWDGDLCNVCRTNPPELCERFVGCRPCGAACIGNEELCEVTTAALPTPSPTTPSTRTSTTLSATTPSPPTLPPRSVDTSVTTEVSSTSSTTSSTSSTSTSTALSSSSTAPSSNATSSSGLATAQVATEGESGVPTMVIIGVSCALIVACAGALAALVLHRRSRTTRRYHGDAASQGHMMSAYPSAAKQRSRKGSQRSLSRRASSTTLSHAAPVYSRWQSYAYGDLDPSQAPPTSAGSTSAMSYVVGNLGAGVAY